MSNHQTPSETEVQELDGLKLGRVYLRKNQPKAALHVLQRAVQKCKWGDQILVSNDPSNLDEVPAELLSYYGLCTALVERRFEVGIKLCEAAVERDFFRADFYLNLGRAYLAGGQRPRAISALRKGIETTDNTRELQHELRRLGVRSSPPIPFLPRSNFINKYIGKLLYRLKGKKKITPRG